MCLAIPGRVVWIGEPTATSIPARIESAGTTHDIDLIMLPDAGVGDYVVVHSGLAFRLIDRTHAEEALELFGIETS